MNRIRILILFAPLLAILAGADGCSDDGAPVDPDVVALAAADGAAALGAGLLTDPQTFDQAVIGLTLQAWGDSTRAVVIPTKQAIEGGTCTGQTSPFTIDPSPYVGLPGTPTTPEEVDAARAEVQQALALALPAVTGGLRTFSAMAEANHDVAGCTILAMIADFAGPAGDLTTEILTVIEDPGAPFTFPGMAWDCSACQSIETAEPITVAPGPAPLDPRAPASPAPAPIPTEAPGPGD